MREAPAAAPFLDRPPNSGRAVSPRARPAPLPPVAGWLAAAPRCARCCAMLLTLASPPARAGRRSMRCAAFLMRWRPLPRLPPLSLSGQARTQACRLVADADGVKLSWEDDSKTLQTSVSLRREV